MLALRRRDRLGRRLIEGLWGEHPPATAAKMVQQYVSQLRKAAADGGDGRIVTRGRGYELRIAPDDRRRVPLRAAASPRAPRARRWRSGAGRRWPTSRTSRSPPPRSGAWRSCGSPPLRRRSTCDLADGRHRELVGELEALIAREPLRERLHAQLMLALYRSGRQADALDAYRQARATLVEQIGVEPGPELRSCTRRSCARTPRSPGPAPRSCRPSSRPRRRSSDAIASSSCCAQPGGGLRGSRRRRGCRRAAGQRPDATGGRAGRRGISRRARASRSETVRLARRNRGGARCSCSTTSTRAATGRAGARASSRGTHALVSWRHDGPGRCRPRADAGRPRTARPRRHRGDRRAVRALTRTRSPARAGRTQRRAARRAHRLAAEWARGGGTPPAARRPAASLPSASGCGAPRTSSPATSSSSSALRERAGARRRARGAGVVCPFRGLAPFDVDDAPFFFGRERLVGEMLARLAGASLLGVVGPSGSGKSSAVRAGLLPELAGGVLPGSEAWTQTLLRPGEHPLRALERAIARRRHAAPARRRRPVRGALHALSRRGRAQGVRRRARWAPRPRQRERRRRRARRLLRTLRRAPRALGRMLGANHVLVGTDAPRRAATGDRAARRAPAGCAWSPSSSTGCSPTSRRSPARCRCCPRRCSSCGSAATAAICGWRPTNARAACAARSRDSPRATYGRLARRRARGRARDPAAAGRRAGRRRRRAPSGAAERARRRPRGRPASARRRSPTAVSSRSRRIASRSRTRRCCASGRACVTGSPRTPRAGACITTSPSRLASGTPAGATPPSSTAAPAWPRRSDWSAAPTARAQRGRARVPRREPHRGRPRGAPRTRRESAAARPARGRRRHARDLAAAPARCFSNSAARPATRRAARKPSASARRPSWRTNSTARCCSPARARQSRLGADTRKPARRAAAQPGRGRCGARATAGRCIGGAERRRTAHGDRRRARQRDHLRRGDPATRRPALPDPRGDRPARPRVLARRRRRSRSPAVSPQGGTALVDLIDPPTGVRKRRLRAPARSCVRPTTFSTRARVPPTAATSWSRSSDTPSPTVAPRCCGASNGPDRCVEGPPSVSAGMPPGISSTTADRRRLFMTSPRTTRPTDRARHAARTAALAHGDPSRQREPGRPAVRARVPGRRRPSARSCGRGASRPFRGRHNGPDRRMTFTPDGGRS